MTKDEKNTNKYELAFWLKDESDASKIKSIMDDLGLQPFLTSELRHLQFAYPINKLTAGYFGFIHFEGLPENVSALNHALKVENACLRYIISKNPIKKMEVREMRRPIPEKKAEKPAEPKSSEVVTNEELEKKLEEILK